MPGHIILVMFGFLMLTSGAATLSDAATPSNPDESKSSVNGLAKSSTPSASAFSNLFNTVESEALMDYIEALPKRTVKRLLDDDQLTDFVSAYENQIFNQDTVFVSQPDYAVVHDAIAKIVTSSEISGLISLFTFNVSVPSDSIPDNIITGSLMNVSRSNVTANSTERPEYPDYNICQGSFEVAELARANYSHLPAVKTLVRMEHVVSHPMIQIYATKLGLSRVLRHPNLLQQLKTKKNKLLNVLFLDMSMISLLETKITCYKILSDDSMMVRFRVAFGKILNAMELSAIPSYFQHISQFTARALNKSSLIVEFDYNYTSPVIEIDRENQNPCLFFNLLDSCENGGVCVGFTGVGNCRCPEGFKGTFCQSRVRPRSNKTDSVLHLWMNFVYMLVGIVLVSATIILFGNFLKSCREEKDKSSSSAAGEEAVVVAVPSPVVVAALSAAGGSDVGVVTPYQLPPVAAPITTSSSKGPSRDPQMRTRTRAGDKGCGASYSVKKKPNESSDGSLGGEMRRITGLTSETVKYDHLTVP